MMIHKSHHRSLHTFVLFLGAWRHLSQPYSDSVKFCCIAHSSHLLHGNLTHIMPIFSILLSFNWTLEIIFYLPHCCYRKYFFYISSSAVENTSQTPFIAIKLLFFFSRIYKTLTIYQVDTLIARQLNSHQTSVEWLVENWNAMPICVRDSLCNHWFNSF